MDDAEMVAGARPVPDALRIALVRELAHVRACQAVNFPVPPQRVVWQYQSLTIEGHAFDRQALVEQIGCLGIEDYLKKRIFVLCARDFGEWLLAQPGRSYSAECSDEILGFATSCVTHGSVHIAAGIRAAVELLVLYRSLLADLRGDLPGDDEDARLEQALPALIHEIAFEPLSRLISRGFLEEVEGLIFDGQRYDGWVIDLSLEGNPFIAASWKTRSQPPAWAASAEEQLFLLTGHEVGHWIVAYSLWIGVSGVCLESQQDRSGFSVVHLGRASIELGFCGYLKARISSIAAGAFAECRIRTREAMPRNLSFEAAKLMNLGTSLDDYAKVAELLVVYHAFEFLPERVKARADMPAQIGRICAGVPVDAMIGLMRHQGIWDLLRSEGFLRFIEDLDSSHISAISSVVETRGCNVFLSHPSLVQALAQHDALLGTVQSVRRRNAPAVSDCDEDAAVAGESVVG